MYWRNGWAGTPLSWHPSGTLDPVSGASIQSQKLLEFQIQKSPVISDEASLYWRNGWAGIPLGWHSSGTLDLVSGAPIQFQQKLEFQIQKASSFLTRLRCVGGTAGLAFQRDSRPRVRCINTYQQRA